jgi:hypothetical protein
MKFAAVDPPPIALPQATLADFEKCLSEAVKDAQRAEFEARLATALGAEERIEREYEQATEKLAEEVAEIARKFGNEAAKVTRKRVPPLRLPSVRVGEPLRHS